MFSLCVCMCVCVRARARVCFFKMEGALTCLVHIIEKG